MGGSLTKLRRLLARNYRLRWQMKALPRRAVILIANPRAGSTWFANAIRCHPGVEYLSSAVLYRHLGLSGRRYPRDLTNGPDAVQEIEIRPGKWEKIPLFDVSGDAHPSFRNISPEAYAIEKCHPEFFGFKPSSFLEKTKG